MHYKVGIWDPGAIDVSRYLRANNEREFMIILSELVSGSFVNVFAADAQGDPAAGMAYHPIIHFAVPPTADKVKDAYWAGLQEAEKFLTPEQQAVVNKKILQVAGGGEGRREEYSVVKEAYYEEGNQFQEV